MIKLKMLGKTGGVIETVANDPDELILLTHGVEAAWTATTSAYAKLSSFGGTDRMIGAQSTITQYSNRLRELAGEWSDATGLPESALLMNDRAFIDVKDKIPRKPIVVRPPKPKQEDLWGKLRKEFNPDEQLNGRKQFARAVKADVGLMVQVRDSEDEEWSLPTTLLAVLPKGYLYRYITGKPSQKTQGGKLYTSEWKQARVNMLARQSRRYRRASQRHIRNQNLTKEVTTPEGYYPMLAFELVKKGDLRYSRVKGKWLAAPSVDIGLTAGGATYCRVLPTPLDCRILAKDEELKTGDLYFDRYLYKWSPIQHTNAVSRGQVKYARPYTIPDTPEDGHIHYEDVIDDGSTIIISHEDK